MSVGLYKIGEVEVEAIQWTGKNMFDVYTFMYGSPFIHTPSVVEKVDRAGEDNALWVYQGEEKKLMAPVWSWIVKNQKGEFHPIRPETFQELFTEVEVEI